MASSPEEAELSDSNPSMNMLPGLEERFSFKTLLFPDNPEPSKLSGFTVNVCASVLGRRSHTGSTGEGPTSPQRWFWTMKKTAHALLLQDC